MGLLNSRLFPEPRMVWRTVVKRDFLLTFPPSSNLFQVTGDVIVKLFGICKEANDGATHFIAANSVDLLPRITNNLIGLDEVWVDSDPDATIEPVTTAIANGFICTDGVTIIGATFATVTGKVDVYCVWKPLSVDGNVAVVTADPAV